MPRNGSGTFTLVSGNPVVTGTTIESNWANTTLSDIATAVTDSLSRSGSGGMTAALRIADGTQGAPGVGFANETGSGFYRAGTGEVWAVVQGAQTLNLDANGVYVPADKTTTVDGAFVFNEAGADKDARFEGDTDVNLVFVDASTDRVGVGTGTPSVKLDVVGAAAVSGNLAVDTNTLYVDASANVVGIGTTSVLTGEKLDVSGGVKGQSFNAVGTPAAFASAGGASLAYNGAGQAILRAYSNGSGAAGELVLSATGGLTDAVLTSTGLGIGTSSPGTKLHVSSSVANATVARFEGAYSAGNAVTLASFVRAGAAVEGVIRYREPVDTIDFGTATNHPVAFLTNNTERMRLDSSGNLGLGVTPNTWSAYKAFQFGKEGVIFGDAGGGTAAFGSNLYYNSGFKYIASEAASYYSQAAGQHQWFTAPSGTAGNAITFTQAMTLTSGGGLLVGTTSDALSNSGSFIFSPGTSAFGGALAINHSTSNNNGSGYINFAYNGAAIGSITQNGTTAVAYNTSSDYRLKDNPQPLTGSGAFIDALQPKTWNWKADGSRGVGFIAHEVQAVSPTSVVGEKDAVDADGKAVMQAMEYGSAEFIANIIAELQSLRARVAALEGV